MANPLVSFIVLSYNYDKYIGKTIESILAQTYTNLQIVIVDDGSADNSVDVIRRYDDPRIELFVHEKNLGAEQAYKNAYARCRGKYIHALDADDWILPECTELQVKWMESHPDVAVLGTKVRVVDADGTPVPQPDPVEEWGAHIEDFNDSSVWVAQNFLCHSSLLITKAAHDAVGMPDPGMRFAPDYDMWVRFHVKGFKFARLPGQLTFYRVHGKNQTHKRPELTYLELIFTFWKYMLPHLADQRRFSDIAKRLEDIVESAHFGQMPVPKRFQLLSMLTASSEATDGFADFLRKLETAPENGGWIVESLLTFSPLRERYDVGEAYNKDLVNAYNWQIAHSAAWRVPGNGAGSAQKLSFAYAWRVRTLQKIRETALVSALMRVPAINQWARRLVRILKLRG